MKRAPAFPAAHLLALACACAAPLPAGSAEPGPATPPFPPNRADLLARHDRNGDGRLDDAEREAMRLALRDQRLKGRPGFQVPPEFLAKYDANRDGQMEGPEWKVAWEAETKILRDTYDADRDGQLSRDEKKAMMTDVGRGKITGIPAFFAGRMAQDPKTSEPEYLDGPRAWLKFDANGNGRADAEELRRLRESRSPQP